MLLGNPATETERREFRQLPSLLVPFHRPSDVSQPDPQERADVTSWTDAPLVFVEETTCPHCGTTRKPIVIRTERGGDGSRSRKQVCRDCSRRWVLVIESSEKIFEPCQKLA